ncbi:hypothetical protein SESBI_22500 [Sesbania bispinosa]|nr:hypothetical protein SESBI_22500 [Sesbania bispinosa]
MQLIIEALALQKIGCTIFNKAWRLASTERDGLLVMLGAYVQEKGTSNGQFGRCHPRQIWERKVIGEHGYKPCRCKEVSNQSRTGMCNHDVEGCVRLPCVSNVNDAATFGSDHGLLIRNRIMIFLLHKGGL